MNLHNRTLNIPICEAFTGDIRDVTEYSGEEVACDCNGVPMVMTLLVWFSAVSVVSIGAGRSVFMT